MDVITPNNAEDLRNLISRVERLNQEKKNITSDISDVFTEAKSKGYDVKAMRAVIKLRALDPSSREEQEYLIDAYRNALGV